MDSQQISICKSILVQRGSKLIKSIAQSQTQEEYILKEKIEKLTIATKLYEIIEKFCNMEALNDQLEINDTKILFILNIIRKAVEEPAQGIPFL